MQDFGHAQLVEAEAIGEPGKRVFRLRVMSGRQTASLKMEKEQLVALTVGIRKLLEQAGESETAEPAPDPPAGEFPQDAELEFTIGRLGIGYEEASHMLVIFAYTLEDAEEDATPAFSCQISRDQSRVFAERAEEVVSGGRPICVLCGTSIDPDGHKCLRRNGSGQRPVSLQE